MNKHTAVIVLPIFYCAFAANTLHAQQADSKNKPTRQGIVVHASPLIDKPSNQSNTLLMLQAEHKVSVITRQRAWYRVATEQAISGWINMLNVRFVNDAKREGELGISDMLSSTSKNSLPTVSTGIRGFDEEDLKKSSPNMAQVEQLNSYAIDPAHAQHFASQGGLVSKDILLNEEKAQ